MRLTKIFCIISLIAAGVSCSPYEHEDLKEITNGWHKDSLVTFEFEITDTDQPYNIYYKVRNDLNYPYYNFYFQYHLIRVEDNKTLSSNIQQVILLDPKTGKPYGKGFTDVFQHSFLGLRNYQFDKPGKYKLILTQYMRKEVLHGILSIGIGLEKSNVREQETNDSK